MVTISSQISNHLSCDSNLKNSWLSTLLTSKFFNSCEAHSSRRRSEANVYCIDCSGVFCRHCVKLHCFHELLQICKYVYQDVVRLHDIQKHVDCSGIQTYKINGEKAVHLNPRPQAKDAKPSTKAKFGGACHACGRYLQDLPNRFCSIACKVEAVRSEGAMKSVIPRLTGLDLKSNNTNEERIDCENELSVSESDISEESRHKMNLPLKPKRGLQKRKSFPRRAPFF